MPVSNYSFTLLSAAQVYLSLGYSVIPVRGDADASQPKAPPIAWKPYQSAKPSEAEITSWYEEAGYLGLGIVTGRVSNLLILDFDQPHLYREFRSRHPHLAETRTVHSLRGTHLYFRLPPRMLVPSLKGDGLDLLSDGCYAVAPPTVIGGSAYRVAQGGIPYTLSADDVHHIRAFIQAQSADRPLPVNQPVLAPPTLPDAREGEVESPYIPLYQADLTALYHRLAPLRGRNNALFDAARLARDSGWNGELVKSALVALHADYPGRVRGLVENRAGRVREARRTIDSVFSRPPRKPSRTKQPAVRQLPNSVREKLLQLGQTPTLRVLERLFQLGVHEGTLLTHREMKEHLAGTVGDHSIRAALLAVTPEGEAIFERVNPSPIPPTSAYAASHSHPTKTKKCFFVGDEKPTRSPKHRPPVRYKLPEIAHLCHVLNVPLSASDTLTQQDLTSGKKTRQAVHRELIRRRPGIYSRRWLARRLGVTVGTLDDYNRAIPISFKPMFFDTPIHWSNLNRVPLIPVVKSVFLEDEAGKRYPAVRELAARLLKQGRRVTYRQQDGNYYWYGSLPDMSIHFGLHPRHQELENQQKKIQAFVARQRHARTEVSSSVPAQKQRASSPSSPSRPPPETTPTSQPKQGRRADHLPNSRMSPQPKDNRPLDNPADESRARQLYERMRTLAVNPGHGLSLKTARQVVATYHAGQIEWALSMLQSRGQIENPAGYLIAVLRSSKRGERPHPP